MLLIYPNQGFEEALPCHVIPAEPVQLIPHCSGHSSHAECPLEQVNVRLDFIIFQDSEINPQLFQDIALTMGKRERVIFLRLAIFHLFREQTASPS